MKNKILFLDQFGDKFGGGQVILLDILDYFKNKTDRDLFVGLLGDGAFYEKVSNRNIRLWKLPNIDSQKSSFWLIRFSTFFFKSLFTALSLVFKIKKNEIKIVYCNGGRTFLISIILSLFQDIYIVWHLHLILKGKAKTFVNFFGRRKNVVGIIAVSETVKSEYLNSKVYDKIAVIHNWVSPTYLPIVNHDKEISNHLKSAIIGQISYKKGQWFVLQTLENAKPDLELELFIVGDSFFLTKSENKAFEKKINQLNDKGWNIQLTGFIDQIPRFLEKIDVLIIPSQVPESFGLTAIEAMSKGVLVVANSIGALPEIIEDKSNGFLFNTNDPDGFLSIIREISERKYPIDEIRKRAMLKVESEFNPNLQLPKVNQYVNSIEKQIYFDARLYHSSGIGTYIQNLVFNFEGSDDSPPMNYLVKQGFNFKKLRNFSRQLKFDTPIYSLSEQIKSLWKTLPDNILHVPHYNAPILYKGTLIVTIHDICHTVMKEFFSSFFQRIYAENFLRRVLQRADAIITVSEFSKKEILAHFEIPEDKISVIHNGVNRNYFKRVSKEKSKIIKEKYNLPEEFLLFLGNVRPHKNLNRLIKAYEILLSKRKDIPPLVIAGELKKLIKEYSNLRDLVAKLELDRKIIFTGYLPYEDIPALYTSASLLIFPSLYEGFGFPALEAMSCGTPVIASDLSSLPEVVGNAAYLVNPYIVEGLANAMLEMTENNELREDLIKKGYQRCDLFPWEKSVRMHQEIYQQFL